MIEEVVHNKIALKQDSPEVLARKAFIMELTTNSEIKWVEYTLANKTKTIDIRAVVPSQYREIMGNRFIETSKLISPKQQQKARELGFEVN